MTDKDQIPGSSAVEIRISKPAALALLILLLVAIPATGADLDMLRLLFPGAGNISDCKPSDLLRLGEEYREMVALGGVPEGVPAEAIAEAVFAQGWSHDGVDFLFLSRVDRSQTGHLESLHDWKYREVRGGFSVLRTGPERHDWERVLVKGPGRPVYYWGSSTATQASLENLDSNILPAPLQVRLQRLQEAISDYHCFYWARQSQHALEDLDEPAPNELSSQLTAVIDESLHYWRVRGDSWETRAQLTVASEAQLHELQEIMRQIADQAHELVFDDAQFVQNLAEMFYLGPTTVASQGRTLTLTMTGPKDKILKATTEIDQQREARKQSGPKAK